MKLGELAARTPGAVLSGDPDLDVEEVTHDVEVGIPAQHGARLSLIHI